MSQCSPACTLLIASSLLKNTDIKDSRKAESCCLSGDFLSHQLVPVPSFQALAPFVFSYFTSLEPVRFGLGSVGSVANISTASNNDEQDDLGKEPCPAAALLVAVGGLTGALASFVLSAR
jgi:hypothetical protein